MQTGGRSLGNAYGSIEIKTDKLQGVTQVARQVGQTTRRELDQIGQSARQAETSFSSMGSAARSAGALIASYFTARTVQAGVEMARAAARSDQLAQRFSFLAQNAGQSSTEMLASMREASRGHIADTELMLGANRAMLLGAVRTSEEMETLLRITGARAGAMGLTFTQGFDAMVTGLGRLEPELLDNLGLMINLNDVYGDYAAQIGKSAQQLDATEKRQALYNEVVAQSRDLVSQHTAAGVSNAGQFQVLAASVANAKVAFGDLVQDDVVWWAQRGGEAMTWLSERVEDLRRSAGFGVRWGDLFAMSTGGRTEFVINDEIRRTTEAMKEMRQARREAVETGNFSALPIMTQQIADMADEVERLNAELTKMQSGGFGPSIGAPRLGPSGFGAAASPAASTIDTAALRRAQVEYWRDVQAIDQGAAQQRADATRQYEQQRADVVRAYGQSMARDEEDHQRHRARRIAQHEASIARIRTDATAREAQSVVDLADRIADMRQQLARRQADADADFAERRARQQATHNEAMAEMQQDGTRRLARLESDAQRERERAQRQHRDTILGAAANLDARAVAQEMRRWRSAQSDQEQALTERVNQERANLRERMEDAQAAHDKRAAEEQTELDKRRAREARDLGLRIAQEQAAHNKRLEDARAADEQRIEEQQAAFEAQQAQEDEDRGIRLGRQAQDHRDQLDQMARNQVQRLTQIDTQAGEQRAALDAAFEEQLTDLGLHNSDYATAQRTALADSLRLFRDYWDDWNEVIADERRALNRPGINPPFVVDPTVPTVPLAPTSVGGATTTNSRSILIQEGAIRIELPPNVNAQQTVDLLHEQLIQLLEEASD